MSAPDNQMVCRKPSVSDKVRAKGVDHCLSGGVRECRLIGFALNKHVRRAEFRKAGHENDKHRHYAQRKFHKQSSSIEKFLLCVAKIAPIYYTMVVK